jgi:hypothetical protein
MPQAGAISDGSLGGPTAKDWLGGIVYCLQGFLAGAAAGAAIGAPAGGIGAIPAALIGGAIGCASGAGAYALAMFVQEEKAKQEREFVEQQSAAFQAQIAQQQQSLESGLGSTTSGLPTWVIPAALAIVGIGFIASRKKAST